MRRSFIERFNEEVKKEHFWDLNKKIGACLAVFLLAVIMINTTGCTQNEGVDTSLEQNPIELPKDSVKVGNDGVNAAIAPDDTNSLVKEQPSEDNSMVAMAVVDTGRSDPFLPESEKVDSKPKPKGYDILPPPESLVVDSTATDLMTTKVSGIMFDNYNPSAILNISGSDYLVRSGDVINGYKVLSIGKEIVTVQYGSNVYKAGVGELFSDNGINFNTISNLESKFGGRKNSVNKH